MGRWLDDWIRGRMWDVWGEKGRMDRVVQGIEERLGIRRLFVAFFVVSILNCTISSRVHTLSLLPFDTEMPLHPKQSAHTSLTGKSMIERIPAASHEFPQQLRSLV